MDELNFVINVVVLNIIEVFVGLALGRRIIEIRHGGSFKLWVMISFGSLHFNFFIA